MPVDILFLGHNRIEFTRASLSALAANTDWNLVHRVVLYDDGSTDGTADLLREFQCPAKSVFRSVKLGSPVAVMNDYLTRGTGPADVFAKIDNDTMLPPGWLNECERILEQNPRVDLLGIEAMHRVASQAVRRYVEPASYIGGIGLMRTRAFAHSLPRPDGRFGFTGWQDHETSVQKAWIDPALPVCLLDRMPMEPWRSLSAEYVGRGWQRPWACYSSDQHHLLWEWFQQ